MTRVNLIDPALLTDQHLMAEWRELKMVPAALRRSLLTKSVDVVLTGISPTYTLNSGHVRFFYPRMQFLTERYDKLTLELLLRGYELKNLDHFSTFTNNVPAAFFNASWKPNSKEIAINVDRILLRVSEKPNFYKLKSKPICFDRYKRFLTENL